VEGDPLFCGLENGRAKGNTPSEQPTRLRV
jgi:hypothetical protein